MPLVATRDILNESYPAVDTSVPIARRAVADYAAGAGVRGEQLDALRLAVSEAVTNVVRHAYRGRRGDVSVRVALASNELWVLITDHGCGYQTPAEDPGLGWGFALMANACEQLVVSERAEAGTEVRMRFVIEALSQARD